MNVLVYSGAGTSLEATKQAIESFRWILSPYYAVTTINDEQLINEPWADSTKMLVIPGGADLPYCKLLNGQGNARIKQFVRKGGVFFGICAGGYYGASQCIFEQGTALEVSGPRELAFYKGAAKGCAYKGFEYGSNAGSKAAAIRTPSGKVIRCFYNGGSIFEGDKSAETLFTYVDDVECVCDNAKDAIAAVFIKYGSGSVILSGVHLEYSMDSYVADDLADNIRQAITDDSEARLELLREIMGKTGLNVSSEASAPIITPLYLTCLDASLRPNVSDTMENFSELTQNGILTDTNDSFTFCTPQQMTFTKGDKVVGVFDDGVHPSSNDTPYFNLRTYYSDLLENERKLATHPSGIGRTVLYGEIVTSTSTMMDRNPQVLKSLPHGFVCIATQQIAGRGRGSNAWVNPKGVLPVSGILRVAKADLRQSLVFVQYLISMAVVDAVYSLHPGYKDLDVRLKWPNDIYIGKDGSYAKIGGVIVTVSFVNNAFVLTFGCGTNVSNSAPTTSLNSMITALNNKNGTSLPLIREEQLAARWLSILDEMWVVFLDLGFGPFEQKYYKYWLHSDKIVRLDQYENARAIVKGITPDTGMLLVQTVDSEGRAVGTTYELQPDGNSFDMLKGLIKKKER